MYHMMSSDITSQDMSMTCLWWMWTSRLPSSRNRGTELPCEQGIWSSYVSLCSSIVFVRSCSQMSRRFRERTRRRISMNRYWRGFPRVEDGGSDESVKVVTVLMMVVKHGQAWWRKYMKGPLYTFQPFSSSCGTWRTYTARERTVLHRKKGHLLFWFILLCIDLLISWRHWG